MAQFRLLRALVPLLAVPALQADGGWLRLATSRFELYTNTNETVGRKALLCFEQARLAIASGSRLAGRPTLPLRIFLFASAEDFEPYRSSEAALGYFLRGANRNYIAIQFSGQGTLRIIFHEYVHSVLKALQVRLPDWLEEGTAEFYSTTVTDGARLYAGFPAPDHLQSLRVLPLLDAEAFAGVNRRSALYNERYQAGVFYSQSWGMVHMLTMAPEYRERFPYFVSLIKKSVPQETAFSLAFGKSIQEGLNDMAEYVRAGGLQALELDAPPVRLLPISGVRELSSEEVEPLLEELREEMNRNR